MRYRDLKATSSEVAAKALSREVDYANASSSVYNRVAKEITGVRADVAALKARHVGALDSQLSSARLVAARLAGVL